VDRLRVKVNGDFQEFQFSGPAGDVIDSASFSTGEGALQEFPAEPQIDSAAYSVIPGHMGQAWVGSTPEQFFTVTDGEVLLENDVLLREREFGASLARGISPGVRKVSINFSLYELNDAASKSLYQAARQRSPISVTLQLGQQAGQLFGIYLKSVVPEVPDFDDSDWGRAKEYSERDIDPKQPFYAADFKGAKFIWTDDLLLDNTVLFRRAIPKPPDGRQRPDFTNLNNTVPDGPPKPGGGRGPGNRPPGNRPPGGRPQ
jgi:hypothetical protein